MNGGPERLMPRRSRSQSHQEKQTDSKRLEKAGPVPRQEVWAQPSKKLPAETSWEPWEEQSF